MSRPQWAEHTVLQPEVEITRGHYQTVFSKSLTTEDDNGPINKYYGNSSCENQLRQKPEQHFGRRGTRSRRYVND